MAALRSIFFDIDGVLVDSLPQHLQLCRDKAREFGLNLHIPTIGQFRQMVSRGVNVSPMRYFFLAIGFPEELTDRAVEDYKRDFVRLYRPPLFDGADLMVSRLAAAGFRLGVVTSNTRSNALAMLGPLARHFEPSAMFFEDTTETSSKSARLRAGIEAMGVLASECVYVGDQPNDEAAARDCGVQFLGVTYGWGFVPNHTDNLHFEAVDRIDEIPAAIMHLRSA